MGQELGSWGVGSLEDMEPLLSGPENVIGRLNKRRGEKQDVPPVEDRSLKSPTNTHLLWVRAGEDQHHF